jgi:hypothetical protein
LTSRLQRLRSQERARPGAGLSPLASSRHAPCSRADTSAPDLPRYAQPNSWSLQCTHLGQPRSATTQRPHGMWRGWRSWG